MRRRPLSRLRFLALGALVVALYYLYGGRVGFSSLPKYEYVPTSFDWRSFSHHNPVSESDITPLPTGEPRRLPRVQHDFARDAPGGRLKGRAQRERRDAVRRAFVKSWNSYKAYAWGADELLPVSAGRKRSTFGGYAATLVDALDTLWIMGLKKEFTEAVAFVARVDWMATEDKSLNVFETTIRYLGGLLSAYDLSREPVLLAKAVELGDMLYAAFDTPNRIPGFWLDFEKAKAGRQLAGTNDPSACPGSLSLEFTRLAQLTGDNRYYDAVDRVTRLFERTQYKSQLPGMWPTTLNFRDEDVAGNNRFTLGALADSLYEYLPKMYALLGGSEPRYEHLYRGAMGPAMDRLLFRPMLPTRDDILFAGNAFVDAGSSESGTGGAVRLEAESEHLTCFVGGMFGLGGRLFGIPDHVDVGERLARGCAWAYSAFPAGVMPEIFGMLPCSSPDTGCTWNETEWLSAKGGADSSSLPKGFAHARDPRYQLRPEAIESVFLMYRMTGKPGYRDAAWTMFEAVMAATETEYGNSAIASVTAAPDKTNKVDSMESFWLAETLKYFYLIFSEPDLISLDEFVFNTEAHPFRLPVSKAGAKKAGKFAA